jgi:hypothetical protein
MLLALLGEGQRFHRLQMRQLLLQRRLLFGTIQANLHLFHPWQEKGLASGHILTNTCLDEFPFRPSKHNERR